jgi:peptide chain release factor subunit 3
VKNLVIVGFSAILHLHSIAVEVRLERIICLIDRRTGKRIDEKNPPRFLRQDQLSIVRLELSSPNQLICLETFDRLSRFTLREESRTLALGRVLTILE